ncbi:hypothetical protein [Desulfoluna butyratoxydans]|uniref:Leucine-rich repeat n=1 Tax=Desulfoluna butyratoxydans TaxID=231438 RepID=A0A4V6ILE6_9BACT|nr:hypothetical protein [Desulfoluna butyratoxydans]VFQ44808.1 leucine-rich repeat [Desulfoluna butyratoxydans]
MKTRFIVLTLSALLLLSCKISGKVSHNNEPLKGVKIILSDGLSRKTITNMDGNYSFEFKKEDATGQHFTITPELDGYIFTPEKKQVKFTTEQEISNINFSAKIDIRPALIDLYNSTDGDSWSNNAGWKEPPLESDGFSKRGSEENWYGIEFDTTSSSPLIGIDLSNNGLTGSIPQTISTFSELVSINLSQNNLLGAIPDSIGSITRLESIDLSYNRLRGTIPSTIVNLKKLSSINLSHNHLCSDNANTIAFLDSINPDWGHAQIDTPCHPIRDALMDLYDATNGSQWTNNGGWGTDDDLYNWYGVQYDMYTSTFSLNLQNNNLQGMLPASLSQLSNLTSLNLSWNQLTGTLPENIGNMSQLRDLHLGGNQLSGPIPQSIGELTDLYSLQLDSNELKGIIPSSITKLKNLSHLMLMFNHLCTTDEETISFLDGINPSWRQGQMDTPCLPIRDILTELYQTTNGPQWTNNDGWGTDDDLRNWYGVQYDMHTSTFSLNLQNNNLQGMLPASLSQLSNLTSLNLSWNQLTGTLPENIGNMSQLRDLHLGGNQLSGPIPQSIGELTDLYSLQLDSNELKGIIPSSITKLKNLSHLMLMFNHLCTTDEETISFLDGINPNWRQGQMDTPCLPIRDILTELYQTTNGAQWTNNGGWGTDDDLYNWYGVQYDMYTSTFSLNLSNNNLQGMLPASLSQLSNLTSLDLSWNQLTGTLPENIGHMSQLRDLLLGGNQLSGPIPQSIGELTDLYSLQLDSNELKGIIPSSITKLKNLSHLMLEFNHLCTTDEKTISFLDGINSNWRQGQVDTPCDE